jgi:hypothetical protein
MPRLFQVTGLQTRKRALAQESDVYRELLKMQLRNVTLASLELTQKLNSPKTAKTLLMYALPFALKFFKRPSPAKKGFLKTGTLGAAVMMFQTVRRYAPMLMNLFSSAFKRGAGRRPSAARF